jgi:hypothetical protein
MVGNNPIDVINDGLLDASTSINALMVVAPGFPPLSYYGISIHHKVLLGMALHNSVVV